MNSSSPNTDVVQSILSTGLNLASESQSCDIPRELLVAGKFVCDNWAPIKSACKALMGRDNENGNIVGGIETVGKIALSLAGLGVTANLADVGLSFIKQRLQSKNPGKLGKGKEDKKDPLRGLNSRSKAVMKSQREPIRSFKSSHSVTKIETPLQQLVSLFPDIDRSLLGDMLANNNGSMDNTIDQLLAMSVDTSSRQSPQEQHQQYHRSTPLPLCPQCPVCYSNLAGKRLFQCASGHHVCHECKANPQLKVCPTCRGKLVGRATNMEQLLANLYGRN